ncbi:MAG: hypothetical protein LBP99_08400 [Azoarcus sp.]|jgi:hypothetical protein|nr:hypothetical protein [Azoarcus sp.]
MKLAELIRKVDFTNVANPANSAKDAPEISRISGISKNCSAEKPGGGVSYWWRVTFPCGKAVEVFTPSGNTRVGILKGYPTAVDAEPFELEHTRPVAPMNAGEGAAIRAWLASIGECSPEIINDVLAQCEKSAEARGYYLGWTGG